MTHERGNEHKHEHEHNHVEVIEQEWGTIELEAHTHEQAATVSMSIHPKDRCSMAFSDLVNVMQSIAQIAESSGGIVGHIKGFARQDDKYVHVSVTTADLEPTVEGDSSFSFGAAATIQLVAIVLLVDQADLLDICKEALAQ